MATHKISILLYRLNPIRSLAGLFRFTLRNFNRIYAAGLIVLISALTYMAVSYLVTSLAVVKGPPPQISGLPTRLSPDILKTDWAAWQALSATENARSPLAHYHRLDSWIAPDRFNDCTRSGCHAALPHSRRKEVRAFLNMHATSMHCGVCHMRCEEQPLPVTWYSLKSGDICESPAVLKVYGLLMTDSPNELATAGKQDELVALIREAAGQVQEKRDLEQLADHFAAVRPGSPSYQRLIIEARKTLPSHFRGEYGAKIALRSKGSSHDVLLGHPDTESAIQAWLNKTDGLDEEAQKKLLAAVHPLKREKALNCTDCHTTGSSLLNFEKLGYPPARRQALFSSIVFRMIEHISKGQAMHLPEIAPAQTTPSTQPVESK